MTDSGQPRWRCSWCGYETDGAKPVDPCPVCGAPADEFIETARRPREEVGDTSLFYKPGGPLPGNDPDQ